MQPPEEVEDERFEHEVDDLTTAVRELRALIESGRQRFGQTLLQVTGVLEGVAAQLEEDAREVAEVAETVGAGVREGVASSAERSGEWQALQQSLGSRIDELAQGASGLVARTQELTKKVETVGEELGEAMQLAAGTLDDASDQISDAENVLTEKLDDAKESLRGFVEAFQEVADGVAEAIEDLVAASVEDVDERVDEALSKALEAATEALDELAGQLADEAIPRLAQQLAGDLVGQLTATIDELLAGFREILGRLREDLFAGASESGQSRAAVEAALEQLQFLLDPIQAEIGRIRDLASTVGISV